MAISTDEQYTQETEDQANTDALHNEPLLTVPDVHSIDSIAEFKAALNQRESKHGVISLTKLVDKCRAHLDLADTQFMSIKHKVARLNGDRTPLQQGGDKQRSLRNTAKRFYETLSDAGLKMQCQLFGINYDAYPEKEDVVNTLVEKHLEMSVS